MKKKFLFSLMFLFFFLFFARGGWLPTDIRLDTGDAPGTNQSWYPQISSSGDNVYVVWDDYRNGYCNDIYFNCSTDGGKTWKIPDDRVDLGGTPGANYSWKDADPGIDEVDNARERLAGLKKWKLRLIIDIIWN